MKVLIIISIFFAFFAQDLFAQAVEGTAAQIEQQQQQPAQKQKDDLEKLPVMKYAKAVPTYVDPLKYTLGPEDVIEINVLRHPEFSGIYPVNLEGKVQYRFVGDIDVTGLNKRELEEKVAQLVSNYVINPEVNITVLEYKSKVIYVLGEVGQPGKYYVRSESIPVREALIQAGLPTLSAAMRRCQLITPSGTGKRVKKIVNVYELLYGGDLKRNIDMKPGDVLFVPATVMAKLMRVIMPITAPVASTASVVTIP